MRPLEKVGEGEERPPWFLYLFSDRACASWDAQPVHGRPGGHPRLLRRCRRGQADDLAIDKVESCRRSSRRRSHSNSSHRPCHGTDFDTELLCQLDNEPDSAGRRSDKRSSSPPDKVASSSSLAERRRRRAGGTAETTYQVTVRHQTPDSLPFNNTACFATFLSRERRKVLTIVADEPAGGRAAALESVADGDERGRVFDATFVLRPRPTS